MIELELQDESVMDFFFRLTMVRPYKLAICDG